MEWPSREIIPAYRSDESRLEAVVGGGWRVSLWDWPYQNKPWPRRDDEVDRDMEKDVMMHREANEAKWRDCDRCNEVLRRRWESGKVVQNGWKREVGISSDK